MSSAIDLVIPLEAAAVLDEHPEDLVVGHDEPVITVVLPRLGSVKELHRTR